MAKQSRQDWVRAGLQKLADRGIEAVRVEVLAKTLGVTKGSFYWHFKDRAELLDAMLEDWAEVATENVIATTERAGADPAVRLKRLIEIASEGYFTNLELALRNWARHEPAVGQIVDQVDRRRMDFVRELMREIGFDAAETEARTYLLYASLIGKDLLADSHGRFGRKRVLRDSMELLITPVRTGRRT